MKHAVLAIVAFGISLSAFAQGDSVLPPQQAKVLEADFMGQQAALEQSQLRVQALGDAINALKAAKGDDREVAALEQLFGGNETQLRDCQRGLSEEA